MILSKLFTSSFASETHLNVVKKQMQKGASFFVVTYLSVISPISSFILSSEQCSGI